MEDHSNFSLEKIVRIFIPAIICNLEPKSRKFGVQVVALSLLSGGETSGQALTSCPCRTTRSRYWALSPLETGSKGGLTRFRAGLGGSSGEAEVALGG